jgi:hypothetical protein
MKHAALQILSRLCEADKGSVRYAGKHLIRETRDHILFVEKAGHAQEKRGHHNRNAGESTHADDRIRLFPAQYACAAQNALDEAGHGNHLPQHILPQERARIYREQAESVARDDPSLHTVRSPDKEHLVRGISRDECFSHGKAWKYVTSGTASSNEEFHDPFPS